MVARPMTSDEMLVLCEIMPHRYGVACYSEAGGVSVLLSSDSLDVAARKFVSHCPYLKSDGNGGEVLLLVDVDTGRVLDEKIYEPPDLLEGIPLRRKSESYFF